MPESSTVYKYNQRKEGLQLCTIMIKFVGFHTTRKISSYPFPALAVHNNHSQSVGNHYGKYCLLDTNNKNNSFIKLREHSVQQCCWSMLKISIILHYSESLHHTLDTSTTTTNSELWSIISSCAIITYSCACQQVIN